MFHDSFVTALFAESNAFSARCGGYDQRVLNDADDMYLMGMM